MILRIIKVVERHTTVSDPSFQMRKVSKVERSAARTEDGYNLLPPFNIAPLITSAPLHLKEGRRQVKRYGVFLTCLSSRAVHLEVANSSSLTADAFINAYRRFVGPHGPARQIRSDQGTNFVGEKNELQPY